MKGHQLFIISLLLCLGASTYSKAQTIEEMEAELAALEAELDSVSILSFLDSLLIGSEPKSSLLLSAGYANQVLVNGQDLGLEQFGLNTSASYFHKSGLYGNYLGFYNSETSPSYYLHIAGLGYIGSLSPSLSYNVGYEKSFFGGETSTGLTNSVNASISWFRQNLTATLSYAYLFAEETAHQLTPSFSYTLKLGKTGFLKSIDITPTFSVFWANANILTANFDEQFLKQAWLLEQFETIDETLLRQSGDNLAFFRLTLLSRSLGVEKNTAFVNLNQSISIPVNFQITDRLALTVNYTYLLADNLLLGSVVPDQEGIDAFLRTYRPGLRPRVNQFLEELDKTILFENEGNSNFLNVSLSYYLRF